MSLKLYTCKLKLPQDCPARAVFTQRDTVFRQNVNLFLFGWIDFKCVFQLNINLTFSKIKIQIQKDEI